MSDDWWEQAKCQDYPGEWWFPVVEKGRLKDATLIAYARAKTICDACPVREPCLEEAIVQESRAGTKEFGMWGGLTPAERAKVRRARGIRRPTPSR